MRLHDVGREAVAVALGDQREASGFGAQEVLKLLLLHDYQPCTDMIRESHSRRFRYCSIFMVMSHPRTPRLKPPLDTVSPGFVVDTPWLKARGIDSKSIHDYVARGWLERIARGIYRRPLPVAAQSVAVQSVAAQSVDREESWAILLLSLQRLMNYAVHLGAESALDLVGHVHYLGLGRRRRVQFYGDVPSWLGRLSMPTEIVVRRCTLFGADPVGIEESDLGAGAAVDLWNWRIRASSPKRAILEALDDLPQHASFENLDKVFEGLVSLRPRRLTLLLSACHSVKVCRLFFVFADRHQHGWRKHLDISGVDFGSRPRALVSGGRFHPTYRISVSESLMPVESRGTQVDP